MSFDDPSGRRSVSGRDKVVFDERSLGPWGGRVKVTPIKDGQDFSFEVSVEWTGPPALGAPESEEPVEVLIKHFSTDLDLALAVGGWAATDLRGARVPDLADIADQLGDT